MLGRFPFQLFPLFVEVALQDFGLGQFQLVFGDEKAVVHACEGVFGEGLVFVGAEQDAYGRLVAKI